MTKSAIDGAIDEKMSEEDAVDSPDIIVKSGSHDSKEPKHSKSGTLSDLLESKYVRR